MTTEAPTAVGQKTWGLSLYELHRQPQEVITDATEIAVSPRSLHSELMCPICLDMLRNTMTTKECLHRFCHDCIITALRSGNKECPTCRKKLVSKRSLRPDPNFDMLISKIHPNRDELEAQQAKLLESLQKQNFGMSLEESLRQQALSRATHKIRKLSSVESLDRSDSPHSQPDNETITRDGSGVLPSKKKVKKSSISLDDTDISERSSTNSTPFEATPSPPEVELVFRPLSHDGVKDAKTPTETRFIKTTTNATVEHLVKYLSMRHKLDASKRSLDEPEDEDDSHESLFTLYLHMGPGQYQPLNSSTTLEELKDNELFRGKQGHLELHYAYKIQVSQVSTSPDPLPIIPPMMMPNPTPLGNVTNNGNITNNHKPSLISSNNTLTKKDDEVIKDDS